MKFEYINGWRISPMMNPGMIYRWEAEKGGYAERFTDKQACRDFAMRTPGKGY
jgi:hypothetical protein